MDEDVVTVTGQTSTMNQDLLPLPVCLLLVFSVKNRATSIAWTPHWEISDIANKAEVK